MGRRRKRTKLYDLAVTIEVINITPGRRKATQLNIGPAVPEKNIELSGAIVTKSPIYEVDENTTQQKEEISSSGSGSAGEEIVYSLQI